jgi:hypothetical protein
VDLTEERTLPDHSAEHLQVGEKGVLLAVCDGVGGRRAGEVASELALEVLSEEMESLALTCPKRDLFLRRRREGQRPRLEAGKLPDGGRAPSIIRSLDEMLFSGET